MQAQLIPNSIFLLIMTPKPAARDRKTSKTVTFPTEEKSGRAPPQMALDSWGCQCPDKGADNAADSRIWGSNALNALSRIWGSFNWNCCEFQDLGLQCTEML